MLDWLSQFHPVMQALLATCFTWGMTAFGAAGVFLAREVNRRVLDTMLGFSAGVMIAASYWSLLAPAIEMSEQSGNSAWFAAATGFLFGGFILWLTDKVIPHLHLDKPIEQAEGLPSTWRKSILLVVAITIHNFPEGLAVGVAFGAVAQGLPSATLAGALALAIGIGIQNFPEGLAVSMPLRRENISRMKSFWYGQLSGTVEPIGGVLGALAVIYIQPILPYALSFAAGAMIFVVVEELIPEALAKGDTDLPTIGVMLGFTVMMVLDVALG